jgi:trk system potassium uptake protein
VKSSFYTLTTRDIRVSLKDLAAVLRMLSVVMLLPIIATLAYGGHTTLMSQLRSAWAFILPAAILYCLYVLTRSLGLDSPPNTKNVMLTVALAWLVIALVGSIPFMVRGVLTPLDSFFESMSGWTTTGYTMVSDFESVDRDLLLYRGIMEGIGGLGVISLGMMVMMHGSNLAVGYTDVGIQKIKPGIRQTIIESWKIYGLYILLGVVLLYVAGMSLFDAVNHSMSAMATGGFSTHRDIGYYDSFAIEAVLMFLMFLGMTSFIVHYRLFSGDWSAIKSDEMRYFLLILAASIVVIGASIWGKAVPGVNTLSAFDVLRKTGFHVISGMSTSGFATVDLGRWPEFAKTFMLGLIFIGGMSASTAGGIRVIRFAIIVKAIHYSLKKMMLPKSAIVVLKVDGKPLRDDIVAVIGYCAIYLSVAVFLALGLTLMGYPSLESIFTVMSAMGNAGLQILPTDALHDMPGLGKMDLIVAMWIGRIEIYPGLLILRALMAKLNVF